MNLWDFRITLVMLFLFIQLGYPVFAGMSLVVWCLEFIMALMIQEPKKEAKE